MSVWGFEEYRPLKDDTFARSNGVIPDLHELRDRFAYSFGLSVDDLEHGRKLFDEWLDHIEFESFNLGWVQGYACYEAEIRLTEGKTTAQSSDTNPARYGKAGMNDAGDWYGSH